MPQVINTNIASLNSQRNLNVSQNSLNTALQRLSSGLRINSAKDDAAGLAISERMTAQIRGLNQAARNANDGISLAQTAEGALVEVTNNLQRIRELAVQSANATNSASDRAALQAEVDQLAAEINRVATQTDFNGTKLLNGSFSAQQFQVGANAGEVIMIDKIADAQASSLGKFEGINLTNQAIGTASDTKAAATVKIGSDTAISLGTIANDAKAIANAINTAGIQGMSASANETEVASVAATAGTPADTLAYTINGTTINLTATGNATTNVANAMEAINAKSAVTGVRAVDDGTGLKLVAADGRNINVLTGAGAAAATDFGLGGTAITGAKINIAYSAPEGKAGSVVFANAMGNGSYLIEDAGTAVNAIDISTVEGANQALVSIDAALKTVNSSRADLGAIQNRFGSTIANLQTTSENLSASRSRIQDTDFAAETAALTRAQILQQAGVAMLAQANALPNNVLSLLR